MLNSYQRLFSCLLNITKRVILDEGKKAWHDIIRFLANVYSFLLGHTIRNPAVSSLLDFSKNS